MKQKLLQSEKKRMSLNVLLLFMASCIAHSTINILVKNGPTVTIDEGLYTNIARSLAWDGELAFRGQPVNYPFLLYPILLVPVYWLNYLLKGDVYRYVQVFNTLLVTSSMFPAYLFARDFSKDERKAFLTAILVALMPDMIMGGYEMTECILWPLALWLFFFGYRYYVNNRYVDGCMTGLITGLMFFAKPGAIVMGSVLLLVCLVHSIRDKERSKKPAIASLILLLVMIGLIYCLYFALFHSPSSLIGLYAKQTSEWRSKDVLVALEATILLAFLFVFACGGIFGILPAAFLKHYSNDQRGFIRATIFGVIAVIIGIAVFVVPYKWNGSLGKLPLHIRYCSMFIPIFFAFSIAIDVPYDKMNRKLLIGTLIVFIVLSLFPGARVGFVQGETSEIDSVALAAFATIRQMNGALMGWLVTILMTVSLIYFLYSINSGWKLRLQKSCTVFFFSFVVINAVCAHICANVSIDPGMRIDAKEVNNLVDHTTCLGVTQRYYDDIYSFLLDSKLNAPMQQVTIDQMIVEMQAKNGVYSPFVPIEQPPNVNNHATPDTDTLVLGMTIAEHLELSDSVQSKKTSNSHFTIVTFQPGERWVDSMLYGLDKNTLVQNQVGYLHIFDLNRNVNGNLILHITASGTGVLVVQGQRIELSSEKKMYTIELPFSSLITIQSEGGNAEILSYSTDTQS